MVKVKQINNLTIKMDNIERFKWVGKSTYPNPNYGKYAVYTPDGKCWEDGLTLEQAEEYCNNTTDFKKNGGF